MFVEPGRYPLVTLGRLSDVDDLHVGRRGSSSARRCRRPRASRAPLAGDVAGELEDPDRPELPAARAPPRGSGVQHDALVHPQHEPRVRPERAAVLGHADRTGKMAGRVSGERAHVEYRRASRIVELARRLRRRQPGTRLIATTRSVVGGRGVAIDADSRTNSWTSRMCSAGFVERSCAIVERRSELMLPPHSEPATWPG